MVTLVVLPGIVRSAPAADRLHLFQTIEGRFAFQARASTPIAAASGLYMTHRLAAWDRFTDPAFWWMYTMVLVWAIFTIVPFIAEPLFLHRWSLLSRSWSNLDAVWARVSYWLALWAF
ncbi:MAG: hypothetical protein K8F92_02915 [Hyphomicrobium sp.]|uniref:hypothetical protein n=1 Tax=Hyphomicrobium sp. TaxID=82 RepID=UPI001323520A|nr:hypothetical protein [Hyphomicrobium sp.]KAB2942608.1 MAG: hypothetical protein F9K20_06400 [Hyphomicrobium sp.]MBZ0208592.1 hypothetical protein [Hyphomicrobium sp.]